MHVILAKLRQTTVHFELNKSLVCLHGEYDILV